MDNCKNVWDTDYNSMVVQSRECISLPNSSRESATRKDRSLGPPLQDSLRSRFCKVDYEHEYTLESAIFVYFLYGESHEPIVLYSTWICCILNSGAYFVMYVLNLQHTTPRGNSDLFQIESTDLQIKVFYIKNIDFMEFTSFFLCAYRIGNCGTH